MSVDDFIIAVPFSSVYIICMIFFYLLVTFYNYQNKAYIDITGKRRFHSYVGLPAVTPSKPSLCLVCKNGEIKCFQRRLKIIENLF